MNNAEVLDHAVKIARLLADRSRLDIVLALVDGELNVSTLSERLGRPMPGVSQHLAKLRDGGLVATRRDGVNVYYFLTGHHIDVLAQHLVQQAEHMLFAAPPHHD